ncbi:MAG TPA: DUF116 domain-containing protein [Anaerolineales bacterium]|nr:DUF116 domain-containing protein [Anaerolineales bacterium]
MTRIITYSLRLDQGDSDAYYRLVAAYAGEWSTSSLQTVGDHIAGFRAYQKGAGLPGRTDAEYAFELLALGVLLQEHGAEAEALPSWLARALVALIQAQKRYPKAEGLIKSLRGWLAAASMARLSRQPGLEGFSRLLSWLRANGESGRAKRLAEWRAYLQVAKPEVTARVIQASLDLARQFEVESQEVFGRYTQAVPRFLNEGAPRHRRQYDFAFVSRTRLEYHLGLLGSELLSRAYRQRFLASRQKVVILPPCMRARAEGECLAVQTEYGARCQACTPSCRVHQITCLGKKYGFEVWMIPDELLVFAPGSGEGELGLVGVSCALTNWSGGWEAQAMGLPAQGVLLDYVGCHYHWDDAGFPTDVNLRKLSEVLDLFDGVSNHG